MTRTCSRTLRSELPMMAVPRPPVQAPHGWYDGSYTALLVPFTANGDRCGAALRPPIGPKIDGSALKIYSSSNWLGSSTDDLVVMARVAAAAAAESDSSSEAVVAKLPVISGHCSAVQAPWLVYYVWSNAFASLQNADDIFCQQVPFPLLLV